MDTIQPTVFSLLIAWGVVTAVLLCLIIYRGTLESREDDQIFLDSAQEAMAREQRALVARITKLSRPITVLWIASISLIVLSGALWFWQAFKNF